MSQTDIPKTVPIKKIIRETPLVNTYVLPISLGAKPGQFVNVWIAGVDEKPMSVAFDDGKNLSVAVAAVGRFSKTLARKKVGDTVGIRGPYGTHFTWRSKWKMAMVAGGYGAAPLYFAAFHATQKGCHVDVFLGARTQSYLLYKEKFRKLKNVALHVSTDDGSEGFRGFNVQMFEKMLKDGKKWHTVMTCGPEMMMKKVSDLAWRYAIPAQIDIERYMKCGFGVCGNCCVDDLGIPTCLYGTIIDNETARKIREFGAYHRDDVGRKHYFA